MSGILHVNATDPRISTTGAWSGAGNTLTCNGARCKFLLLFRGTGITMYGKTDSLTNGALYLELDGTPGQIALNGTTFSDGVAPIYHVGNMGDDDHQLLGDVSSLVTGTILMDHFEVENTAPGGGFELLNAGPTARNVPAEAVIVDNNDPAIIYNNDSLWEKNSGDFSDYGQSLSSSFLPGASLSFSFDGVAIWYYGHSCVTCGSFKVSIDSLTPQRFNGSSGSSSFRSPLFQRMVWSNTSLDPGRHTITLTHDDNTTGIYLDFFRVLPRPDTSTPLSSFSTTNLGKSPTTIPTTVPPVPPTNQNQSNTVPLAVGLTLGLLVLVVAVYCGVRYIYPRRRREPIDLDSLSASPHAGLPIRQVDQQSNIPQVRIGLESLSASPYAGPPIRQADQQSNIPQVQKGVPQPAQTPDDPMATVDPDMGLGPPPSYESSTHDWRVGAAK